MGIFHQYDIRGIYGDELDEDIAYKIGRAYVKFLGCKNVAVGQDMRPSGDSLKAALIRGITEMGADVTEIGLCSTPMLYFATANYGFDGSIMVTASHNPKEYNGFKMNLKGAVPIGMDNGIADIQKMVENGDLGNPAPNVGKTKSLDIKDEYRKHLSKGVKLSPMNIVLDAGNGMGSLEIENVIAPLAKDSKLTKLFMELDGSFPNHEANPIKIENIRQLIEEVKKKKADLGIAFDGDADRVAFVDENGEPIPGDLVTALIAKEILRRSNGRGKVLYDLRSSWSVKEAIEESGGTAIMCRVGHAFIKRQMREVDALFAGELSGHYYFKDNFFTDSGIYAAVLMLSLLSREKKKLSELVKPLRRYFQSGEINSKVKDPDTTMAQIESRYKSGSISHLDGIRVEFGDYWFNIRKSNTEPLLRLNVEARTEGRMKEVRDSLLGEIRK